VTQKIINFGGKLSFILSFLFLSEDRVTFGVSLLSHVFVGLFLFRIRRHENLLTTKYVSSTVSKEHERAHYVWVTYPLNKSLLSCPKTPNFDQVQST